LVHFGLRQKIAAVNQAQPIDFAVGIVRAAPQQRDERMLLVTARPAAALDRMGADMKGLANNVALPGPRAGELQQIEIGVGEVDAGAQDAAKGDGRASSIAHQGGTRDRVPFLEDGVGERDGQAAFRVGEIDLERGRFGGALDVGRRQTGEFRFSARDAMGLIDEVEGAFPIGQDGFQRRGAEVASPVDRVFEREQVETVTAVLGIGVGAERAVTAVGTLPKIAATNAWSPIIMEEAATRPNPDRVGRLGAVKKEGLGRRIVENGHKERVEKLAR